MALVPCCSSLWRDWWEDFGRPHRLLDAHFHHCIKHDDFCHPLCLPPIDCYFRPWDSVIERRLTVSKSTTTTTTPPPPSNNNIGKFTITIDVKQYSLNEMIVKTIGNSIIIEAKHEECKPGNGHTTTEFMRRYELPSTYDINRVMANLSTDGTLTITAPKIGAPEPQEKIVPIDRLRVPVIKS